jgi:hypothetical protein
MVSFALTTAQKGIKWFLTKNHVLQDAARCYRGPVVQQ